MKTYQINEVFYSLQGEGIRVGTPNVFVRFSGCNLTCAKDGEAGFDCDTEFASGRKLSFADLYTEIVGAVQREGCDVQAWLAPGHSSAAPAIERGGPWVILTGGEPGLQVDEELVSSAHAAGLNLAIESNGTKALPPGIDWVCCSPKSAEHTLRIEHADELKYVRNYGQGIPRPSISAAHMLISPAFRTYEDQTGSTVHEFEPGALDWCMKLVRENPIWRLSVQMHKMWGVR